ncbi:MAG: guanylate kinase [Bacteroidetes bacterium]|nr:guanylate kinase [Bacteroidota bacterium]
MKEGKLILFCGPSGSGKTTITRHLLEHFPQLSFSVSATTRKKRASEVDGEDYHFLTVPEFKKKIETDQFVEWEEVYTDLYYGTLKSEIERIWNENKVVAFDVDVEGGMNIKKIYGNSLLAVFIKPLSVEVLRKRLTDRNTESPESLAIRIAKAELELTYTDKFDHIIVNDTLEHALEQAKALVKEFLTTPS